MREDTRNDRLIRGDLLEKLRNCLIIMMKRKYSLVILPLKVDDTWLKKGTTAPWFGEAGGGNQYKSDIIVQELIDAKKIKEVYVYEPTKTKTDI